MRSAMTSEANHTWEKSYLQVFLNDLARWHAGLQPVQRLVQAHLCASHKNELGQHAHGSDQILRFPQKISQDCGVTEIKELMLFWIGRINLAIEIIHETEERPASARQ